MALHSVSPDLLTQWLKEFPENQSVPNDILLQTLLQKYRALTPHYENGVLVNISWDDGTPVTPTAEAGRAIESGEATPQRRGETRASSDASGASGNCVSCGAVIEAARKYCVGCEASQAEAAPATIRCIACGAEIPEVAKICQECGAAQNHEANTLQQHESAVAPPETPEMSSSAFEDSTVGGIECQTSANPQTSSVTANQTSTPAEAVGLDESASKRKKLFKTYGIAAAMAVVIVSACIVWFSGHPISARAQYNLGVAYENGQGVAMDDAQAAYWYRKAADQGDADAQTNLGVMYANGFGGLAKDDAQAVTWYRKAAEQGNAKAQYNLGIMYANGKGVQEDDAKAVSCYRNAAEQGYAHAQNNLGVAYANGQGGLAKDDAQAVSWYRKAADQGDADAQTNLGAMYESGRGGLAKDYTPAVAWYQKAADQGNAQAKVALANVRALQQQGQQ
jgi:TPR repeat protein